MEFRKVISTVVLVTLLTWTMGAMCTPLPTVHRAGFDKMAYRTMLMEHPKVAGMPSHKCCPPQKMVVIVCYRMHKAGDCDTMNRCRLMHAEVALSGSAKYHDDGQARACATAHATNLLIASSSSSPLRERAGLPLQRSVLDAKADLRI